MEIKFKDDEVIVITLESPLGQQLVGKKTGDCITLQSRGPALVFRVISVR